MDQKRLARLAGLFYLIIIVCGIFSEGFVRMSLVVPGDALQTTANIQDSEMLFRLGFVSDIFMVISDVVVAVLFFYLLRPVSEMAALLATFFRLGQAAIIGMNLLNHFSPLLLLSAAAETTAIPELLQNQVLFYMESHRIGYLISQVFFSFNCAVMGYLLVKSQLFPKLLGYAVSLAAVAYFVDAMMNFVVPSLSDSVSIIMIIPVIAEFLLCIWLLTKGTRSSATAN